MLRAIAGESVDALVKFVNGLFGASLVAAGLFLSQVPWIDIAQAPGSDAFGLIQFHFILTGAFSLWSALAKKRGSILASFSLLLLGANGWLAFLAIVARDPSLIWPMIFIGASGINYLYLLAADLKAQDEPAGIEAAVPDADADLVSPQFGVVTAGSAFGGIAPRVAAIVFVIAAMFAIIFFGTIYLQLLKAAIFDRNDISFDVVIENIRNGAADLALLKFGATAIVIAVLYGAIFSIEALIRISHKKKLETAGADFNRDLDRTERVFIRDAMNSLLGFLGEHAFDPKWGRLYGVGAVGVIASFLVTPLALIAIEEVADAALKSQRIVGGDPILYSGPLYVGAAIGGFLAGSGLFWSLYQYLGARHPEFGAHLFSQQGWNSLENRPRTSDELLLVLVRHVRNGRVKVNERFDPFAFLVSAFREHESVIYKMTTWFVAAAIGFTAADIARFMVVDAEGVHYSKYLQFASRRVAFADIDRVELRCRLFEPDDHGNVNLGVDYILVKDGEFKIDLFDTQTELEARLAPVEKIDEAIAAARVPINVAPTAGLLQGKKAPFSPNCAGEVAARYDPETAARLIRLMRVEQFANASQN